MSHYSEVDTAFRDQVCLVESLQEMGYKVEVHEGEGANLYGYQGDRREQKANVIVSRQFVGRASNDLGWKWNSNSRCFIQIVSEFDAQTHRLDEGKLKQMYAEKKVVKKALKLGYRVKRKVEEGVVQLLLMKY